VVAALDRFLSVFFTTLVSGMSFYHLTISGKTYDIKKASPFLQMKGDAKAQIFI
jgi:hypothetical protein